jgi:hypothetical protein
MLNKVDTTSSATTSTSSSRNNSIGEPLSRVLTTVTSTESSHNNSDYWVRDATTNTRRRASGRGMFSGLQDVKHYNVEHGWARRDVDHRPGFFGALWNNITGGSV